MGDRFSGMKKVPKEPAKRLMALANAKLTVPVKAPASASVDAVLTELEAAGAHGDMLRLLSAALPVREGIWWGCVSAEGMLDGAPPSRTLAAAQAWVFKPTEATRDAARAAAETAEADDDMALIATAVGMCDGKLGTGDLAQYEAPPGAVATMIFGTVATAWGKATPETFLSVGERLIDSAVDIARGGNGQVAGKPPEGAAP